MCPELAHDSFERLFVLANKCIKLLVLIEEVLVFGEDRAICFFEFCVVCFCSAREMEGVKNWKGNAPALREVEIEPAKGKTGARVEGLGLENDRVRGL